MVRNMFALQLGLAAAPLIGWGLGDLGGFASNPARLAVVAVAITSCSLVARQQTLGDPFATGAQAPSRAQSALLVLGIMSVPIVLGGLAHTDRRNLLVANDSVVVRSLGLLMYAVGEGVRIVALRALGPQYSAHVTVQRHHSLVRAGIYRLVRHPIYLAQVLTVPGMALAFRSLLACPLLVVSLLFVWKRIRNEEALLERTFPGEFEEYRRGTWRLLPFVY
jgi:protein-S-isoprenylcysteine O-methyltransferase Ste14